MREKRLLGERGILPPLIYDLEIARAIPVPGEEPRPGIDYCQGWGDHAGMGITVLGAYDYATGRTRVFCADNLAEFTALAAERLCVGFNNVRFDNAVLRATIGSAPGANYDLLAELWRAAGLGARFTGGHAGFSLDAVCARNFGLHKTGNGALAPVLWQQGRYGEVIDYCLMDVLLTRRLFDAVLAGTPITSPKDGRLLRLPAPGDWAIPMVPA